jgi:hypothetical protein
MSCWGSDKPDGFLTITGPYGRQTIIDLTAVFFIDHDPQTEKLKLVLGGGTYVETGEIGEEARKRIVDSWMAMRRKP